MCVWPESTVDGAVNAFPSRLKTNRPVPCVRSQENDHDPARAHQWRGRDLATVYLKNALTVRWPQEGLTTVDIEAVWE